MPRLIRKAVGADLPLQEPLKYALYDENQRLLLKRGFVISMPGFAERLLLRGCYIGEPDPQEEAREEEPAAAPEAPKPVAKAPVFLRASDLVTTIRRIHRHLAEPPTDRVALESFVRDRAQQLIAMLNEDGNAVIAAPYLTVDLRDPRPSQQLLGAIVVAILAPLCDFSETERVALVCAALTRDAGLLEIDRDFGASKSLPDEVRQKLREHPKRSVEMLMRHRVSDRLWLSYVLEHHERPDGQGYPLGRKEGEIQPASLLLALADSYAAMVLANPRRSGIFPANSLKELFLEKGSRYVEKHIAMLVKTFGRFPPGTLVSLTSGEIGVVKTPAPANGSPVAHVVYDRSGMPRSAPVPRDTAQKEFAIVGCVSPEKCQSASLVIRRLWQ